MAIARICVTFSILGLVLLSLFAQSALCNRHLPVEGRSHQEQIDLLRFRADVRTRAALSKPTFETSFDTQPENVEELPHNVLRNKVYHASESGESVKFSYNANIPQKGHLRSLDNTDEVDDVLCLTGGLYIRGSAAAAEYSHGKVLVSGANWECGVDKVLYRRVVGDAEQLADDVVYVPTQSLTLGELLPSSSIKLHYTPPVHVGHHAPLLKFHKTRGFFDVIGDAIGGIVDTVVNVVTQTDFSATYKQTWMSSFNYDADNKKAAEVITKEPKTGVKLTCKSCYAYLEVSFAVDLLFSPLFSPKTFKVTLSGAAGFEADWEVVATEVSGELFNLPIAEKKRIGTIRVLISVIPVIFDFDGSLNLAASIPENTPLTGKMAHSSSFTTSVSMGVGYTAADGFKPIWEYNPPNFKFGTPTMELAGNTEVRFHVKPLITVNLQTVFPVTVELDPFLGVKLSSDGSVCPASANENKVGYQLTAGVSAKFGMEPLKLFSIDITFGGLLPFSKVISITDPYDIKGASFPTSGCLNGVAALPDPAKVEAAPSTSKRNEHSIHSFVARTTVTNIGLGVENEVNLTAHACNNYHVSLTNVYKFSGDLLVLTISDNENDVMTYGKDMLPYPSSADHEFSGSLFSYNVTSNSTSLYVTVCNTRNVTVMSSLYIMPLALVDESQISSKIEGFDIKKQESYYVYIDALSLNKYNGLVVGLYASQGDPDVFVEFGDKWISATLSTTFDVVKIDAGLFNNTAQDTLIALGSNSDNDDLSNAQLFITPYFTTNAIGHQVNYTVNSATLPMFYVFPSLPLKFNKLSLCVSVSGSLQVTSNAKLFAFLNDDIADPSTLNSTAGSVCHWFSDDDLEDFAVRPDKLIVAIKAISGEGVVGITVHTEITMNSGNTVNMGIQSGSKLTFKVPLEEITGSTQYRAVVVYVDGNWNNTSPVVVNGYTFAQNGTKVSFSGAVATDSATEDADYQTSPRGYYYNVLEALGTTDLISGDFYFTIQCDNSAPDYYLSIELYNTLYVDDVPSIGSDEFVVRSTDSDYTVFFVVELPTDWVNTLVTCNVTKGDFDIAVFIGDFSEDPVYSSTNVGSDVLGVLQVKDHSSGRNYVYVALNAYAISEATVKFSNLGITQFTVSQNVTDTDSLFNVKVDLDQGYQYFHLASYADSAAQVLDLLNRLNGTSTESTGFNALVKPYLINLVNTTNTTVFSTQGPRTLQIKVPLIPGYHTTTGEEITYLPPRYLLLPPPGYTLSPIHLANLAPAPTAAPTAAPPTTSPTTEPTMQQGTAAPTSSPTTTLPIKVNETATITPTRQPTTTPAFVAAASNVSPVVTAVIMCVV